MEEEEREAAVELELLMHTGRTAGTGRLLGGPVNAVREATPTYNVKVTLNVIKTSPNQPKLWNMVRSENVGTHGRIYLVGSGWLLLLSKRFLEMEEEHVLYSRGAATRS